MQDITSNLQLGATFILAMALIELVKWIITKYTKNGNNKKNNKRNAQQDIDIAIIKEKVGKIETNHLPHIMEKLEKNEEAHTDIKVEMVRMNVKLDEVLKNQQK